MDLNTIETVLGLMDPNLFHNKPAWHAGVVLMASINMGQDPQELAEFAKLPLDEVMRFVENLNHGLWVNGQWSEECSPLDPDHGGTYFMLAISIATGDMVYDAQKRTFALTKQGMDRAEKLVNPDKE